MTDFKVALDPVNPRCMVHPDQRLISTPQMGGAAIATCPICTADILDAMARWPGTITVRNGEPRPTVIEFVGGPAAGHKIARPTSSTVIVPVPGKGGFGEFRYTLRRCRDAAGNVIEVLAPAGLPIDHAWLAARKLFN